MLRLLFVSLLPSLTLACGGGFFAPDPINFPVVQAGGAIVVGVSETTNATPGNTYHVTMHVQIRYQGSALDFGWIIPVPGVNMSLNRGTELLFQQLFRQTLPTFVWNVDPSLSTTCTSLTSSTCLPGAEGGEGVAVVYNGTIGPYDYQIVESTDDNPENLRDWLVESGYAVEALDLLNYYVLLDYKFVLLRLSKDTTVGDIEPIVIDMDVIKGNDTSTLPAIASVPLKLTSISATDNMPITVYILGDAQATPINYLKVIPDDLQVPWIRCQNNNACFDDAWRQQFSYASALADQLVFVTEFARPTSILSDKIAIQLDLSAYTDPKEMVQAMIDANIPSMPLVDQIVDQYLPKNATGIDYCETFGSLYQPLIPFVTDICVGDTKFTNFDATAFANAIQRQLVAPSLQAQAFVNQHPYLTRLYAEISPGNMTNDPFFQFDDSLEDVSNIHTALAVPICDASGSATALEITVADGRSQTVSATYDCFQWFEDNPVTSTSMALQYVTLDRTIVPSNGQFNRDELVEALQTLDALVIDQTVLPYQTSTSSPSKSSVAAFPLSLAPVAMPSANPPLASPIAMTPVAAGPAPPTSSVARTAPTLVLSSSMMITMLLLLLAV